MTELLEAVTDAGPEGEDKRLLRIAAALYVANIEQKIPQHELVRRTGYSRETIRRHVEDEHIRRGKLDPTPRYLEALERKKAKHARHARRVMPG